MCKALTYLRLLSLDVVLGASVSTLFVAKCLDVSLTSPMVAALAIAVWVIYTTDHLLDGSQSGATPLTSRHRFHQKHRKEILMVLGLMMIVGVVLVFQLPIPVIVNGLVLTGCVVAYFIGLKIIGTRPSAYKEPLVALGYAVGVFLAPVSLMAAVDYPVVIIYFAIYVFLAFANLLIFSVYELAIDEGDQYTSLVRYVGSKNANRLITACFIVLIILWSYQTVVLGGFDLSSITLLLMMTTLAAVNYMKKIFSANEWYRVLGDAVFYFPLIALL